MDSSDFLDSQSANRFLKDLLEPELGIKVYHSLYLAVKRLRQHFKKPCNQCSYGDGGHCLIYERLALKVTRAFKRLERKLNGRKKAKT
jgi:hypothetical protein